MIVFVINKHGESLMPCKPRKARLLLKQKKAKILSYQPFTIQLLYGSRGYKQKVNVGIDLGAKHAGVAVTSKKKRSLHEATARKGRKTKNMMSKRNVKNVPQLKGFYLNDKVRIYGQMGYITGFTGVSMAYMKDIHGNYIMKPNKSYKQVNLKDCGFISHTNNWQYEQRAFG